MADSNITVVNFDQFELLLKYCVGWKTADPDTDSKFSTNDSQRFINVENGILYIYEAGNATPIYTSGAAPTEYIQSVSGANGSHHFTLIGGARPGYDIVDVHLLDAAPQNADFLPYISIAGRDFLISQVSKPTTGTSTTYLDYLSVNGIEYKVSTFDGLSVRWNQDEPYYDVSVVNNKGQLDLSFFARKNEIPTIPVTDVQVSTDGSTFSTVVDADKIAKIDLSSFLTSVDWSDLTGTAPGISTFNNDAGYLTSVSWSDLTGAAPSLSTFTNDLVEGNPTIPSGTTPVTLSNLKIGANYFAIPQGGGGGTPTDYIVSLTASGNTLSWTSLVGGVSSSGSFTPSGGSEPAAYIKSISKSGRTLTWTNKDNTTDSLDTSYSDATQAVSGLMSSTDKTKLDGLGQEVLHVGNDSGTWDGNNQYFVCAYDLRDFEAFIITFNHNDSSSDHNRVMSYSFTSAQLGQNTIVYLGWDHWACGFSFWIDTTRDATGKTLGVYTNDYDNNRGIVLHKLIGLK